MSQTPRFDFNTDRVARGYDNVLTPALFKPWAEDLLAEHSDWKGRSVLDLATGTGVVAEIAVARVGLEGKVTGVDLNPQMLGWARKRCARSKPPVHFIESPAHPLRIPDESMDVVVCQQGFQFFPDRAAAAAEITRVLKSSGRVILSTWRSVDECQLPGAICSTLETLEEPELEAQMQVPFNFLPETELSGYFEAVGLDAVAVKPVSRELVLEGGPEHAVQFAYATPIGEGLRQLAAEKQLAFRQELMRRAGRLGGAPTSMGQMVANVLTAEKKAESRGPNPAD